jgi:hypothetical protein
MQAPPASVYWAEAAEQSSPCSWPQQEKHVYIDLYHFILSCVLLYWVCVRGYMCFNMIICVFYLSCFVLWTHMGLWDRTRMQAGRQATPTSAANYSDICYIIVKQNHTTSRRICNPVWIRKVLGPRNTMELKVWLTSGRNMYWRRDCLWAAMTEHGHTLLFSSRFTKTPRSSHHEYEPSGPAVKKTPGS